MTIAGIAGLIGHKADAWGRKPIFLAAFVVLAAIAAASFVLYLAALPETLHRGAEPTP